MQWVRYFTTLVLCFLCVLTFGQPVNDQLKSRMLAFHRQLGNPQGIEEFLDDSLSYGHSNGWIEGRVEFLQNLGSKLVYHSVTEDSIVVTVNGNIAHIRFAGDFDVSLNGKRSIYRLRVLEVWIKKNETWKIFARQAIR